MELVAPLLRLNDLQVCSAVHWLPSSLLLLVDNEAVQALHQTSQAFRDGTSRLPEAAWAEIARRTLPLGHPVLKAQGVRTAAKRFWADCTGLQQHTATCERMQPSVVDGRLSWASALEVVLLLQVPACLRHALAACVLPHAPCCTQPDFKRVLVLVQPDILWLCHGGRRHLLDQTASRVYARRLPCDCFFLAVADSSSPDGRLALLASGDSCPDTELLLWDVTAGLLIARHKLRCATALGAQWLPSPGDGHRLYWTTQSFSRAPHSSQVCVMDGTLRTLATSGTFQQRQGEGCFGASPCGRYFCGVDGEHDRRLVILDSQTCGAVAVASLTLLEAGGDAVTRQLWAPDSSAVLVCHEANPESVHRQTETIFWLRSQCWQPVVCHWAKSASLSLRSWVPQGLLYVHVLTGRTAELRLVADRAQPAVQARPDVASFPFAELALLTRGFLAPCIAAAFSPGFTWLALVTAGVQDAVSIIVIRAQTRQTVQQWCLQPATPDARFSLRWTLSGSALVCMVMDRGRTDTYMLEFDQQL